MEARGAAVVTGASRGIGRALARELAARGFDVVAGVRDPGSAGTGAPTGARGSLRVERLDVCDPGDWRPPDGLRVLVNNAGLDAPHQPLETTPLEAWRALFETNVFGLVEVTRRCLPTLRASGGGVVCNLTSASLLFPMPFYAAYRASKAAVAALGESLRAEGAALGIRVLEVLPGPVRTDMLDASARPPEADAGYAALAARAHAGRGDVASAAAAPEDAARAIADAILDDAAPLRVACDPVGAGLLAGWRAAQDDEAWLRSMLVTLGIETGPDERQSSSPRSPSGRDVR